MLQGVLVTEMVAAIIEQRLAERLAGGPRTATELADEAGVPELPLYRLLRSATGLGIFTELPDGRFGLGPLGAAVGEYEPMPWVYECFGQFSRAIETGKTGMQLAHGADLFEFLERHPNDGAGFDKAMTLIHADERAAVADAYDFGALRTVVDVGGGNGDLLSVLLDHHPALKGVLFDLASVVARGTPRLEHLAGRWEAVGGDVFDAVPAGGDGYLLSHVLHDWPEDRCLRILDNCREAMGADGRLLHRRDGDPAGRRATSGQDARHGHARRQRRRHGANRGAVRRAPRRAGFRLERVVPTASAVSIVEATAGMTGAAAPPVPQVPLAVQFLELTNGVLVTGMVEVLMRHRIAEHMQAGRCTPQELAAATGLPERGVYRLLRRRRRSASSRATGWTASP